MRMDFEDRYAFVNRRREIDRLISYFNEVIYARGVMARELNKVKLELEAVENELVNLKAKWPKKGVPRYRLENFEKHI